jgi:hypothetical protein
VVVAAVETFLLEVPAQPMVVVLVVELLVVQLKQALQLEIHQFLGEVVVDTELEVKLVVNHIGEEAAVAQGQEALHILAVVEGALMDQMVEHQYLVEMVEIKIQQDLFQVAGVVVVIPATQVLVVTAKLV